MDRFPMTPAGRDRMRHELDRLRKERPLISAAIEEARAHGDLRENAEYHAAKEKQGLVEARIREFEAKLAMAQVIDPAKLSGNRVSFGATVDVVDEDTGDAYTYSIVGEDEANTKLGLISYKSPIARGLLGREEGDECLIDTGAAQRTLSISEVRFNEIVLGD